jgi:hypothetical protein
MKAALATRLCSAASHARKQSRGLKKLSIGNGVGSCGLQFLSNSNRVSSSQEGNLQRGKHEPRARRSNRHKTFIPLADTVNEIALRTRGVTAVSSGLISPAGSGPLRVKFMHDSGSLLVKVRGPTAVQEVRIYGVDHFAIKRAIIRELNEDKRTIHIDDSTGD